VSDTVITVVGLTIGIPLGVWGAWHQVYVDQKLKARGYLFMAAGSGVMTIMCVLTHNTIVAAVNGATTAFNLWSWWNSGGGDGMRRLMKRLTSSIGDRSVPQAT
jgi:hypothetical protein